MKKKLKNKNIFPPESAEPGKAENPQMALGNPTNAAAISAGYAGLDSVGSAMEEKKELMERYFQHLRELRRS
jgi:hypothetical protein